VRVKHLSRLTPIRPFDVQKRMNAGKIKKLGQPADLRMSEGYGNAADVLVWTQEAFTSHSHLKASLPGTILPEGRLLYAA